MRIDYLRLWLVVFALAGAYVVYTSFVVEHKAVSLAVLAMVFAVGVGLVKPRSRDHDLRSLALIYLRALKDLRRRWVLWFFGSVLVVNLLGALPFIISTIQHQDLLYSAPKDSLTDMLFAFGRSRSFEGYLYDLQRAIPDTLEEIPTFFFPETGLDMSYSFAGGAAALGLLLLIYPLYVRLRNLSGIAALSRGIRYLRILLPVAFPISATFLAISLLGVADLLAGDITGSSRSILPYAIAGYVWWALSVLLITPFLTSGLVGSLLRTARREQVSVDTFLLDAVGNLIPYVRFYIVFAIVISLPDIPYDVIELLSYLHVANPINPSPFLTWFSYIGSWVIYLLYIPLMFVPLALFSRTAFIPFPSVFGAGRLMPSLRAGVHLWLSNIKECICFVAIGISFYLLIIILLPSGGSFPRYSVPIGIISEITRIAIAAHAALAVAYLFHSVRPPMGEIREQEPA